MLGNLFAFLHPLLLLSFVRQEPWATFVLTFAPTILPIPSHIPPPIVVQSVADYYDKVPGALIRERNFLRMTLSLPLIVGTSETENVRVD